MNDMRYKYAKEGLQHYDLGDHRPHGPRRSFVGNVGGRFLARERGAFRSTSLSKRDVPYVVLDAVIHGMPLAKQYGGCGGPVSAALTAVRLREAASKDFDTAVKTILQDTKK